MQEGKGCKCRNKGWIVHRRGRAKRNTSEVMISERCHSNLKHSLRNIEDRFYQGTFRCDFNDNRSNSHCRDCEPCRRNNNRGEHWEKCDGTSFTASSLF